VQESQIAGGPGWFATEKWDITAKCDDDHHSGDETKRMLQHLLEERYSLKIHRETQQRPVYALTVAKGGPKFKPTGKSGTIRSGGHSISMDGGSIAGMADVLASALGRPVVDQTGLSGFMPFLSYGTTRRCGTAACRGRMRWTLAIPLRVMSTGRFSQPCKSNWGCGSIRHGRLLR
jgi:uncharacterized protein (TIGR03435 family)